MRTGAAFAVVLLLLTAAAVAQAPAAEAPLTLHQFSSELATWQQRVEDSASDRSAAAHWNAMLPAKWVVEHDGQRMEVSTLWLSGDLANLGARQDAKSLEDAREHLRALRQQAEAADSPARSWDNERAKANAILSRKEFEAVAPPGWLERMQERFARWLERILGRTIGRIFDYPNLGRVLIWSLIGLAVAVLALWTYRRLTRQAKEEEVAEEAAEARPAGWKVWASEASAAATRGDFREAVRCAYWAAIHRLEGLGLWRPDPARTPREYVRALPSDNVRRPPLLAVTRKFEMAWYAQHEATRQDFEESAAELEKLGCPLSSTQATGKS